MEILSAINPGTTKLIIFFTSEIRCFMSETAVEATKTCLEDDVSQTRLWVVFLR